MIVLVNGSFGIGKTTVARHLVSRTPSSTLFNPEFTGRALQIPLRIVRPSAGGALDSQNLRLWRLSTVRIASCLLRRYDVVYVPMALTDVGYLAEIREGLEARGCTVHHFCLVAPLETVLERIKARGERAGTRAGDWVIRRAP